MNTGELINNTNFGNIKGTGESVCFYGGIFGAVFKSTPDQSVNISDCMNTGTINAQGQDEILSGSFIGKASSQLNVSVKNSVNLSNMISSNTAYSITPFVIKAHNVVNLGLINAQTKFAT